MNVLRLRLEGKELSLPELMVLFAAARGYSAEETAEMLVKSRHTVISQRRSLQAKLGARNLTHAVALAYERRLFDTAPELWKLPCAHQFDERDADAPSYHERG